MAITLYSMVWINGAAAYTLYPTENILKKEWQEKIFSEPHAREKEQYATVINRLYYNSPNKRSFEILKNLADKNVSDAKYAIYKNFWGADIGPSKSELMKYLQGAAQDGYAEAQLALAKHYAAGISVEKSNEKAHFWLEAAALNGNAEATLHTANDYLVGRGTHSNPEQGFNWLIKAYNDYGREFKEWEVLGTLYEKGYGTPVNLAKAYMCYDLAGIAGQEHKTRIVPLMTSAQRTEGMHLSREWQDKYHIYTM